MNLPARLSRWRWWFHCVTPVCDRLRFPGWYRQCGQCRRAYAA